MWKKNRTFLVDPFMPIFIDPFMAIFIFVLTDGWQFAWSFLAIA